MQRLLRFDEFVDQGGGGDVADAASLLGCRGAQCDEEVGLAGAGVTEQDQGFALVDPGPGCQVRQRGRWQVGKRSGVEVSAGGGRCNARATRTLTTDS